MSQRLAHCLVCEETAPVEWREGDWRYAEHGCSASGNRLPPGVFTASGNDHGYCLAEHGDYACRLGCGHVGQHRSGITTWETEPLGDGRSISRSFGGCATCDDGGCRDCAS